MNNKRVWFVIVLLVVLDQASKVLAIQHLPVILNKGAAWGVFQNGKFFFIILSVIVLYYCWRYLKEEPLSLVLITAGIVGNLIDRLFREGVVDFINIHLFNYPWFNVADSCLVIGVILIIAKEMKLPHGSRFSSYFQGV